MLSIFLNTPKYLLYTKHNLNNTNYKRKYDKKKLPAVLEPEEAQKLLKQPNKRYPTGLRNKAILFLMLHCGLRVSEAVSLRPNNINLIKGKLRVESGKSSKDRDLAMPEYLQIFFTTGEKSARIVLKFYFLLMHILFIYLTISVMFFK